MGLEAVQVLIPEPEQAEEWIFDNHYIRINLPKPEFLYSHLWVGIPIALLMTFLAIKILMSIKIPYIRKAIIRMRGMYVPESVMQNSPFITGEIPKCQIGVYRCGTFSDTFVGYAIRLAEDVITLPLHVSQLAMPEMVLKNERTGETLYVGKRAIIETNVVSDLCYMKVFATEMVNLKISIAHFPKSGDLEGFVSVVGKKGMSSGKLTKHMTKGLMEYMGSTLPGYSGAAYMLGNKVYGMHIGAGGTSNLGLSYAIWLLDLPALFKLEIVIGEGSITLSSPSLLGDFEERILDRTKTKTWGLEDIVTSKSKLSKIAPDYVSSWAEEVDATIPLFENSDEVLLMNCIKNASIDELVTLTKVIELQKDLKTKATVRPQGNEDGGEIEVKVELPNNKETKYSLALAVNMCEERIMNIEDKVKELENLATLANTKAEQAYMEVRELRAKKQPKQKVLTGYCCWEENCRFSSRKIMGLVSHVITEHGRTDEEVQKYMVEDRFAKSFVKPEASDELDQTKGNGESNFTQARSLPKRSRPLKNTSNQQQFVRRSQYSTRYQQSTEGLLERVLNYLENQVQPSNGHTLDIRRN